jgi:hypothetical protein
MELLPGELNQHTTKEANNRYRPAREFLPQAYPLRCTDGSRGPTIETHAMKPESPKRPHHTSADFRRRYDDLEQLRTELMDRLQKLESMPRAATSCRRARTLLNATYRKASIVQRAAVLQAAAWLIDVAEMMTPLL